MDTEDFTFPRISDPCAPSIDSPPLWNLSPANSPNPYQFLRGGNKGDEEKDQSFEAKVIAQCQRKSSSCIENGKKRIGLLVDEENRMDLLWEDFNKGLSSTTTGSATLSSSYSRDVVEFRCAPSALTIAKKSNDVVLPSKNKPGMVVIVKVFKKLFALTNSQGKPRKRAC